MKPVAFLVLIVSMFLSISLAIAQGGEKGSNQKYGQAPYEPVVLNKEINTATRIVKASPVVPSAEEQEILEDLKAARRSGDRAAARAHQTQLDKLHGILSNTPQPEFDTQEPDLAEKPSLVPDSAGWVGGDIRINPESMNMAKPDMASASDGTVYVVMENLDNANLYIYESANRGATWSLFSDFTYPGANDTRDPSIAVTEDYIHIAYEIWYSDSNRTMRVYSISRTGGTNYGTSIATGITAADFLNPRICTDHLEFPASYVYVTYSTRQEEGPPPVFFSKSTDNGDTFSEPQDVSGGSEIIGWQSRPDIAFGCQDKVFIVFAKHETGDFNEIWVSQSSNFGTSWDPPVRLTPGLYSYKHPRVSAAHFRNSLVVAYTFNNPYSSRYDVGYVYSTDGGSNWSEKNFIASDYFDWEWMPALTVSNYHGRFHLVYSVYWGDVFYSSADTASPDSWSAAQVISAGESVASSYPRPTICVNPAEPEESEACIAWTERHGSAYEVYFDSASLVGPMPWIPLLLLD